MKKIIAIILLALPFLFFVTGCNNSETTESTTDTLSKMENLEDTSKMVSETSSAVANDFVSNAITGGMMEIELGKLVQTNTSNNDVKEYGKMLEADHSKANDELRSIASSKNIAVPASMGDMHQGHIKQLAEKKGADFDKAYINMMIDDHEKDIAAFKKTATDNSEPAVRDFATKTLPTLQKHLDKAISLKAKM